MARKRTPREDTDPMETSGGEETGEIIPFRIIKGDKLATLGKEPPDGIDWLSDLPLGTMFYVRDRNDPWNYVASEFYIKDKMPTITTLEYLASKDRQEVNVINSIFCRKYRLEYIRGRYIEE